LSEETPDLQGAYPRLSDAQIAALDAQGRRRPTQPGDVLFAEGDRDCDFFVVLAGKAASVEGHGTPEERVIAVHGPGRFLGELSLLTGEGAWYSAVALDAGKVLAVPAGRPASTPRPWPASCSARERRRSWPRGRTCWPGSEPGTSSSPGEHGTHAGHRA